MAMAPLQVLVLHAWLMWAGMGLCMPLGLILVRFLKTARQQGNIALCPRLAKGHMLLQGAGLLLALVGGGIILVNFGLGAGLAHTHGRLGLALLGSSLLTASLGLVRPPLSTTSSWRRGLWYTAHWTLGSATVTLSPLNIFIGMHVFELITATSVFRLNVAYSVQLALMALVYLAQDRWAYMRSVQWALPISSTTTTSSVFSSSSCGVRQAVTVPQPPQSSAILAVDIDAAPAARTAAPAVQHGEYTTRCKE